MPRPRPTVALVTLALLLASCSSAGESSDGADAATTDASASSTSEPAAPRRERPDGPAAEVVRELTAGDGVFLGAATVSADLATAGYEEHEFEVTGTATAYVADGELPTDGTYELREGSTAEYRTRVVVRRPADAADFDGTVVVEWLNVSGGLDANPDWSYGADEILRRGAAWVGVSAQYIGIEGGPVAVGVAGADGVAGKGLRAIDPARYGDLRHPGDAYAYDLYTQVGRALWAASGEDGDTALLGGAAPERLLAVGESQSAFALTTYVNGVQPLAQVYDGFLVHSRGGAAAPLAGKGDVIDIAGALSGPPTTIRTDLDVPVLVLETETDVLSILGFHAARQDDTDHLRLWEVAGTAHADRYLIGDLADAVGCPAPINAGPHHFVVKAALRALDTWVRTGEAPPEAERLAVEEAEGEPIYRRDADGIVLGGIRTPQVDVPVDVLSGDPSTTDSVICLLLGTTRPLPDDRLAARYPSVADYESAYQAAADEAIEAGFVLEEDRDALLADARPARIPG